MDFVPLDRSGRPSWVSPMRVVLTAAVISAALSLAAPVHASWVPAGVRANVASGAQGSPQMVANLSGAPYAIVWTGTASPGRVFARLVNYDGQPLAGDLAMCSISSAQDSPVVASDDSGGVIVAWVDHRSGLDIYAQRIDRNGQLRWGNSGALVCNASGTQWKPVIVKSGSGGAIVAWEDWRGAGPDVYAQKLDANGAAQWSVNGVFASGASSADTLGTQQTPRIASDGQGGAYVCWDDSRRGPSQVYAQLVDTNGFKWSWPMEVSAVTDPAQSPQVAADGAGGLFVAWSVPGATGSTPSVIAHHVSRDTSRWAASVAVTTRDASAPVALVNAASGVVDVVVRSAPSGGTTTWRVAVRRVRSAGAIGSAPLDLDALSASAPDVGVSNYGTTFGFAAIARDSVVRVVCWSDTAVTANNPPWPQLEWTSAAVTNASAKQLRPACGIGASGAVGVAWLDDRNTPGAGFDAFVQRVSPTGVPSAHQITVGATGSGTLTPSSDTWLNHDANLDVTMVSANGWHIDQLQVSAGNVVGANIGPWPNYRFHRVEGDSTLIATFSNAAVHQALNTTAGNVLPFALPFASVPLATFTSVLGTPDVTKWRLGHWNPVSSQYDEAGGPLDSVRVGRGYWLETLSAASLDVTAALVPEAAYGVPLQTPTVGIGAWNQVANPFRFAISDSDLAVTATGVPSTPFLSLANTVTDAIVQFWDPLTKAYHQVHRLEPGMSYWVHYLDHANPRLVFAHHAPSNGYVPEPVPLPADAAWRITMTASRGDDGRGQLTVGTADVTRGAWNRLCAARPPAPPVASCALWTSHADWDKASGDYVTDFVAPDAVTSWDVHASASDAIGEATLAFRFDGVPANARVVLLDEAAGWARPVADGASVNVALGPAARTLKLVVTTDGSAPQSGVAKRSPLTAVAPSPFATRTALVFALGAPSPLAIDVYDLAGRRVYAVSHAMLGAGEHVETWDGRDDAGRRLPAGVYLARWRAAGREGTARLVFVP